MDTGLTKDFCIRSVGSGWAIIVGDLYDKVKDLDPDCYVVQVKEKFGGLRFYVENVCNSEVYNIIDKAEAKASVTCESCGADARVQRLGGWLKCVCDDCTKKSEF